jgi:iron complex transport system ATP-binding protein
MIDGKAVGAMSGREIARRFAYMAQRQEAVHCTVFEAVLLARKVRDGGHADSGDIRRVGEILELVRLEPLAMRSCAELSGGELQKVALARALAQEPKVLLLDEPINHLDPANQIEVMSLLHAVTRDLGITTLVVTHNLNNALRFADRFVLIRNGRVLAAGGREILTPAAIRETFGIEVVIGEICGATVVVPVLRGVRPHAHLAGSGKYIEHSHEVDEHVYDHDHHQQQPASNAEAPQRGIQS